MFSFVRDGGVNALRAGSFTTVAATVPAAGHAAGNLVLAAVFGDGGTPRTESITDSNGGNTWVQLDPGDGGGGFARRASLHASILSNALNSGDTITGNSTTALTRFAIVTIEFTPGTTTEDVANPTATVGNNATPSISITPSSAVTLLVALLHVTGPTSDGFTADADATGGASWTYGVTAGTSAGAANTNLTCRLAWKITTSAAAQTHNPTLGTSRSHTSSATALQDSAAAIFHHLGTLGVGA